MIVLQPQSQTVTRGSAVTFSASVMGLHLAYQWWCNGVKLPDGTNAYYSIANVLDSHAGNYALVVSNGAGGATSRVVALNVTAPVPGNTGQPIICVEPQSQAVPWGCAATLSATVSCDDPVFQWSFNGVPLPDGTNAFYALASVRSEQDGDYQLVVSNSAGSASSIVAQLTVIAPNQIPPAISQIPGQWTNDQTPLGPLNFVATGGTGSADNLVIRAASSDQALVCDEHIYIEGFGANQTITLIPGPGQTGTCYITITVADLAGAYASTSFALTSGTCIAAVNQSLRPHPSRWVPRSSRSLTNPFTINWTSPIQDWATPRRSARCCSPRGSPSIHRRSRCPARRRPGGPRATKSPLR